ncbi:alpha-1,4-glucan--maltose-1-phosphate maltosyltransferase, partial [Burkholderia pseudomallei]
MHAWPPLFERVAAWGFDHVLIGGLWAASRRGYPRHVADPDRPAESFATSLDATSALARLSDSAREHGLRIAVEVVVDRVAREHPLHDAHRDWYVVDERDDALIDPRTAALAHDVAHANVGSAAALDALADWWRARLGALADAGAAAFLVDAPQRMPAHW